MSKLYKLPTLFILLFHCLEVWGQEYVRLYFPYNISIDAPVSWDVSSPILNQPEQTMSDFKLKNNSYDIQSKITGHKIIFHIYDKISQEEVYCAISPLKNITKLSLAMMTKDGLDKFSSLMKKSLNSNKNFRMKIVSTFKSVVITTDYKKDKALLYSFKGVTNDTPPQHLDVMGYSLPMKDYEISIMFSYKSIDASKSTPKIEKIWRSLSY